MSSVQNGSNITRRDNTNAGSFEAFHKGWLVRQEHYLDELLSVQQHCQETRNDDLEDLINRVISHYRQYYDEKARVAQGNIFLLFFPTWLTSFEHTFLWITGFKPALTFHVVNDSVTDLSQEQRQRLSRLVEQTRMEEKALNNELAKIQESVAAPPLLELARQQGQLMDGNTVEEETAFKTLGSVMELVVGSADLLRMSTVSKVMEILNPAQNVKFLTAVAQLQVTIRSWGLQMDA